MSPDSRPTSTHARDEAALQAFVRRGSGPSATFALVLFCVVVATTSMAIDNVPRYSRSAFFVGLALTAGAAVGVGRIVSTVRDARYRVLTTLVLPAVLGATIGVVIQAIVLGDVDWTFAVKDLGGLVTSRQPVGWILAGIVLGGAPALAVAAFLGLARWALERMAGHDAPERFGVVFTGGSGFLAALGLLFCDGITSPPLYAVAAVAAVALVVSLLVDGARSRFLRRVYSGADGAYDVVDAARFASDPSLAPLVGRAVARGQMVLVRIATSAAYRANAAEPIALLGPTEHDTLRPLAHRRQTAGALLAGIVALSAFAPFLHSFSALAD